MIKLRHMPRCRRFTLIAAAEQIRRLSALLSPLRRCAALMLPRVIAAACLLIRAAATLLFSADCRQRERVATD